MKITVIKTKLMIGVASALFIGVTGTLVAQAAIPDTTGTIHGCYATTSGSLRVVDPATTSCKASETALNWNQAGQSGVNNTAGNKTGYIDWGTPLQTLLSIPQFGNIQVECKADGTNPVTFVNTSGYDIDVNGGLPNGDFIPAGQTKETIGDLSYTTSTGVMKVAKVNVYAYDQGEPVFKCNFTAIATYN